jgi:DNA topoisomerase-6 subunit B
LKQSLTAEQAVLVERGGRVERVAIGKLVDGILGEGEEVREIAALGIRAPAFDPKTWRYEWRPVSHVIRHARENEVLEIAAEGGKRIRVTGCHSLFTYDPATREVREVEARALRTGDYVVAPRVLPEPDRQSSVNLLEHLAEKALAARWIYVYGVPTALLRELRQSAEVTHKKGAKGRSRRYYRLRDRDGAPLDVLDDSWAQYERRGFLPAWLVKRLGLDSAAAAGRLRTYHHGNAVETPVTWRFTPALMRLLGLFVAEGHADRRQVGLTFAARETALVEEVVASAHSLGLSTTVEPRERNAVRVKLFGGALDLVFPSWCGRGAKSKRVPEFVFHAERGLRQHFLDGLHHNGRAFGGPWLGDGHRFKDRDVLTLGSASRALIDDVDALWRMQGVVASRSGPHRQRGLGRGPSVSWRLDVYGVDISTSHVFARRASRTEANRYRMFPAAKLAVGAPSAGTRVRPDPESLLQASGLGLGPAGAAKSLGIVAGVSPGRAYSMGELSALAGGRVTRHLTSHMERLGYLRAAGDRYVATKKVETLRDEVSAARSFFESDLCLLRVRGVREVRGEHPHVYDLSVPGCENFVAGEGLLAAHNSRGQQGIGISAAGMYGLLTTGKPVIVTSRTAGNKPAHHLEITIDHKKNQPLTHKDEELAEWHRPHGTRVEIELVGNYLRGQTSLLRYMEMTALANPHAQVTYVRPRAEKVVFPRSSDQLPKEPLEIRPHPRGVELGALITMLKESKQRNLRAFLHQEFSRVSNAAADAILEAAALPGSGMTPRRAGRAEAEALHKAMTSAKLMAPPTNCLSPIGDELMRKGLISFLSVVEEENEPAQAQQELGAAAEAAALMDRAEGEEVIKGHNFFIATITRPPRVYRGNPFQVEVGLAYGGSFPGDKPAELYRFANRVPLLFQKGACSVTEAVVKTDWRNYMLSQPKGSLPVGPLAIMVHIASVWVPFTSESKEAVAHYPEITREIQLAAQECGRKLAMHIRRRKHADYESKRRSLFELYIKELGASLEALTGAARDKVEKEFNKLAQKFTAEADLEDAALMEAAEKQAKSPRRAQKSSDEE